MVRPQPRQGKSPLGLLVAASAGILLVFVLAQCGAVNVPPPRVTPTSTRLALGSTVMVQSGSTFWVDPSGITAWQRAYDNRDQRAMSNVVNVYETFTTLTPAQAQITARTDTLVQVEFVDGTLRGRRGWTDDPVLTKR